LASHIYIRSLILVSKYFEELSRFEHILVIDDMEAVIFLTAVTFIVAVGGAIVQGYDLQ
jgi:hypothetical protein